MKNLYETLGVDEDATSEEIKKAYKGKAMILHPDRNGGEDRGFDDLRKAYEILSDNERRARYDETGDTDDQPQTEVMLRTQFLQIFSVMLDTEQNFKTVDFVSVGIYKLEAKMKELKFDIEKHQAEIDRLATAKNRMTKKDEKTNLFESLLEQREEGLLQKITATNEAIEICEKLIEELNTYEYSHDEPEPQAGFHQGLGAAFNGYPFGGGAA